jgi:hypothetical protein
MPTEHLTLDIAPSELAPLARTDSTVTRTPTSKTPLRTPQQAALKGGVSFSSMKYVFEPAASPQRRRNRAPSLFNTTPKGSMTPKASNLLRRLPRRSSTTFVAAPGGPEPADAAPRYDIDREIARLTTTEREKLVVTYTQVTPLSTHAQLGSFFAKMGKYFSPLELVDLTEGTGFEDKHVMLLAAFLCVMARVKHAHLAACVDDTTAAFLAVSDGKDVVEADHFRDIVADFKLTIDTERLLAEADTDGSGEIELDEFEVMVKMIDSEGTDFTAEDDKLFGKQDGARVEQEVFRRTSGKLSFADVVQSAVNARAGPKARKAPSIYGIRFNTRKNAVPTAELRRRAADYRQFAKPAEIYGMSKSNIFKRSTVVTPAQAAARQRQSQSSEFIDDDDLFRTVSSCTDSLTAGALTAEQSISHRSPQQQHLPRLSGAVSSSPTDSHAGRSTVVRTDPKTGKETLLKMPPIRALQFKGNGRIAAGTRAAPWTVDFQGFIQRL